MIGVLEPFISNQTTVNKQFKGEKNNVTHRFSHGESFVISRTR